MPTVKATQAAKELNLSVRHVYTLVSRYRASGGLLTSLVPTAPKGGRGNSRLSPVVEEIITRTIDEVYLIKQKRKASDVIFEIIKRCCSASLKPPTPNTIRSRINKLPLREKILRRQGAKSLRKLSPVSASFPEAIYPLQVLQIDHTPVDLIIVDEVTRQPIGRPYLTVAIDIYSRCITGFCLTLETPGAVSVGLCLAHSILDKYCWMTERKIDGEWLIWGKPDCIHVDNAAEFHSEALRCGCEQHGIQINYQQPDLGYFGYLAERESWQSNFG